MASQFLARPFAALRPTADSTADVIAPPYDVVSIDEARARGEPAAGQLAALLRQLPGEFFGIGVNFVDSEAEPWVEVNPIDPDNVVAFWQQDRWFNGGAPATLPGQPGWRGDFPDPGDASLALCRT